MKSKADKGGLDSYFAAGRNIPWWCLVYIDFFLNTFNENSHRNAIIWNRRAYSY